MNNKQFTSSQLFEIPGKCGFDMKENKALLTYDFQLIEYDLVNHKKTGESMLEQEVCAIAIHPLNSAVFAIGDQRVNTYDDVLMIAPSLIATMSGKVTCIQYSANGKIMGIASEENQLVLSRDSRISRCKPGHDGMTLTCAFDPKERFVGSIGCDGCLIIYQMSQTPQLLHRYTISKPISPDVNQKLYSDFHPSGNSLWVAGQIYGQYIMTEDDPQELIQQYQILHKSEICIVKWIKENSVITASLDGEIKMWHFKSFTDLSLHWTFDIKSTPLFIRNNETTLYVLDSNCNLIETPLDAPLTNYEMVYKDTNSALQDLLDKKVKRREPIMEEEEIPEDVPQEKEVVQQPKKVYQQAMQDVFRPGETLISKGRQYLCYNTVGTIVLCKNTNMLEFEFFNSTFYKKFKMSNQQRFAYGSLNYRGCVLASKGPNDIDQEGYLAGDGKSIIRFQQFVGDVDDFEIQLQEDEGVEVLTLGNDWFAVLSDHGICRVIGFCGLEITQFQVNRPIITMTAYEHLLCIVFHDTSPIFNQQSIKARVYDVDQQCGIEDIEIYITPFSTLLWIGYSDEGMLTTQDSKGAVRVYQSQRWTEVYRNARHWLYGVQDYRLCLLKTDQPVATSRQEMTQVNFDCQITCAFEDDKILAAYKELKNKQIILNHEQYRWKEFGKYYYARNDDKQADILVRYTQNLYDQNKIQDLQHILRKCTLDLFKAILSESKDKAIEFFRTHIKQEYDMNSIVSILEQQKDKQPTNKEITKLLAQIKLIQRQQIIKSQQHFVADNRKHSPQRKGFGLQLPMDINLKSVLEPTPQQKPLTQVSDQKKQSQIIDDEQEDFNPFGAKSQPNKITSIFDLAEKRKSNQTFGAQNIKKKL